MRLPILIVFLGVFMNASSQIFLRQLPNAPLHPIDIEVNDYLFNHFEIGGGGQLFVVLPGGHGMLRYAPVNYQRIKLMGEIRGEFVAAPMAGWHYSVKAGTSFRNTVGIHAGFGRSHYVTRARTSAETFETRHIYQNTFDLGVRWQGARSQCDVWTSMPLYVDYIPIYTIGISFTFGGLWDFDHQKWFLPKRK